MKQPQYYQPSAEILQKYAHVLVNFALNSGQGVKADEVVMCIVPDVAKPLALALHNELLKAGAHPLLRLAATGFEQHYYNLANQKQLTFFPQQYLKSRTELIDHQINIIADPHPRALSAIEPKKIILARDSKKAYRDWLVAKETQGKFTWTTALWGVPAKAAEVGLELEAYWQQIIKACFLDLTNPVAKWQEIFSLQQEIKDKLNKLRIKHLKIKGPDVDLTVKLGADRIWQGGSGRNIPSFELFTSPDWRGTQGWIRFNEPLYRYGNVIKDVFLEFQDGLVVKAKAKQGNRF
ncbi:MAG: aminopeptidase, partial [Candidatus Pacebacteria bacterium]|nr:aminopeptidase [Candidatus Paceibacterota bacterium]